MNREFKSNVFSMLLEDPENALDIYNALNNTTYKNPDLVEIHSLSNGMSLSIRNDASFIIDSVLNLYEHQSTVNPNMPVRSLIYVARLLEDILKDQDLYGSKLVKIPNIKCVVFYNGMRDHHEKQVLKLSNAFSHKDLPSDIELECTIYNINAGNNAQLLENSKVLRGYMTFVDKVREQQKDYDLEEALNRAVDFCISNNVLAKFFIEHRWEVLEVSMLDYTFERREQLIKRDSWLEGKATGIISLGLKLGMNQQELIKHLQEALSVNETEALHILNEYNTK